jgi:hypothetical protein
MYYPSHHDELWDGRLSKRDGHSTPGESEWLRSFQDRIIRFHFAMVKGRDLLCSTFTLDQNLLWWLPTNTHSRKKFTGGIEFCVMKYDSIFNICRRRCRFVRPYCQIGPVISMLHSWSSNCLELTFSESMTDIHNVYAPIHFWQNAIAAAQHGALSALDMFLSHLHQCWIFSLCSSNVVILGILNRHFLRLFPFMFVMHSSFFYPRALSLTLMLYNCLGLQDIKLFQYCSGDE